MPASPISTTSRSGRVISVPLYSERYQLITRPETPFSDAQQVTWAEVGESAALPADARHAEPPHHRPASGRGRRGGAADAGIEFDDRAVLPYAHRQMVVHHAAEPRRRRSASPSRSGRSRSSSRMPAISSAWWRPTASRTRRWSRRCLHEAMALAGEFGRSADRSKSCRSTALDRNFLSSQRNRFIDFRGFV